jgi:molybdopterin-synthase adenylyltransferase
MGPVVGVVGALQADLALGILQGLSVGGDLVTFDGKRGDHRRRRVSRRAECPLCGTARIQSVDVSRYVTAACDAAS